MVINSVSSKLQILSKSEKATANGLPEPATKWIKKSTLPGNLSNTLETWSACGFKQKRFFTISY
jgi:hypothetical protein